MNDWSQPAVEDQDNKREMLDIRGHASAVKMVFISDIVLRGLPVGLNCAEEFDFRVCHSSGEMVERRFSESLSRLSANINDFVGLEALPGQDRP